MERNERIDTPTVMKIKNQNEDRHQTTTTTPPPAPAAAVRDSLTPEGQGRSTTSGDLCRRPSTSRSRTPYADESSCRDDASDNETIYDGSTTIYDDNDDYDEDSDLYGSQRNTDFSVGVPPDSYEAYMINGRYAFERKERQRRVMRQVLATFDPEQVKDRYRGVTIHRFLSHAERRFREWLETAMGNDNLDLCDRKWNERFREKVMEEYERQQILREKQLAEAEVRRIQKLRLQGTLCDEEDEEGATRRSKRHGSQKRGKQKKSEKYLAGRKSKHQTLYTRPNDDVETQMQGLKKEESNEENGLEDEDQDENGQQEQNDGQHNESSNVDDDAQGQMRSEEGEGQGDRLPDDPNDPEAQNMQTTESSDSGKSDLESRMSYSYKSQLGRAHMGQENHSELHRLYDLEDLRELYAEAESLVRLSAGKK